MILLAMMNRHVFVSKCFILKHYFSGRCFLNTNFTHCRATRDEYYDCIDFLHDCRSVLCSRNETLPLGILSFVTPLACPLLRRRHQPKAPLLLYQQPLRLQYPPPSLACLTKLSAPKPSQMEFSIGYQDRVHTTYSAI